MYTSNMSSSSQDLLNVLLQLSQIETMSGSNEYDKLEKYIIISLILMCNTVTIPYSHLLHYLIYIFEENKQIIIYYFKLTHIIY